MDEHEAIQAWRGVVGAARLQPMDRATNALWRVVAEDGRTWVLKRLPEYAPGVGPVESYRVLSYLQGQGLPVPLPVVTDDGLIVYNARSLRSEPAEKRSTGSHAYTLLPFLPNDSGLRELPEVAHAIGAAIGRLDRALSGCPWKVSSYTDDPVQVLTRRYPELAAELQVLTAPLGDALYGAIVDLPTQRTHGDCNVGNVLVHDGGVTGFIDVDHLPMGPRVRDLSYYLSSRLVVQVGEGDPDAMAAALGHYIAGYHREHPLDERELAAVVPMMITVEIARADWSLNGWQRDLAAYQRSLRGIAWMVQRYTHLVDAASITS